MIRVPAPRVLASVFLVVIVVAGLTVPAEAQYRPLPTSGYGAGSNPKGEPYHIEVAFNFWNPDPNIVIASESLGIPGTDIDVRADLNLERKMTYEVRLVLRPAKKHKFRFNYIPLKYDSSTTLTGDIIFNGIRYRINTQVRSLLEWKTYRFGYEWDFISNPRGFFGVILEGKYTDVNVELQSAIGTEFARAQAPIPALGVTGRVYVTSYASITGEFSAFKLPDSIDENYSAHDYEWDVYGTFNFTKNVGVQAGYRYHDLAYRVESDRGDVKLGGLYFGGVARF